MCSGFFARDFTIPKFTLEDVGHSNQCQRISQIWKPKLMSLTCLDNSVPVENDFIVKSLFKATLLAAKFE